MPDAILAAPSLHAWSSGARARSLLGFESHPCGPAQSTQLQQLKVCVCTVHDANGAVLEGMEQVGQGLQSHRYRTVIYQGLADELRPPARCDRAVIR